MRSSPLPEYAGTVNWQRCGNKRMIVFFAQGRPYGRAGFPAGGVGARLADGDARRRKGARSAVPALAERAALHADPQTRVGQSRDRRSADHHQFFAKAARRAALLSLHAAADAVGGPLATARVRSRL